MENQPWNPPSATKAWENCGMPHIDGFKAGWMAAMLSAKTLPSHAPAMECVRKDEALFMSTDNPLHRLPWEIACLPLYPNITEKRGEAPAPRPEPYTGLDPILYRGDHAYLDFLYPSAPKSVKYLELGLNDHWIADEIRISFDFARYGWCVEYQNPDCLISDHDDSDEDDEGYEGRDLGEGAEGRPYWKEAVFIKCERMQLPGPHPSED